MGLCTSTAIRRESDALNKGYGVRNDPTRCAPSMYSLIPMFASSLSPGAEVLLEPLTSRALPPDQRVDVSKPVRLLTLDDWTRIVKAFDEWPFAPKVRFS